MISIILFATPQANIVVHNNVPSLVYHVATLYRNRGRYKITLTCNIDTGSTYCVVGNGKSTGWEPFCRKWSDRFQKWGKMISWGYDWEGHTFTDKVEAEIGKYCDRLQVVTCYKKEQYLAVLKNVAISNSFFEKNGKWGTYPKVSKMYAGQYVRMLRKKKSGWWKTIQIK